MGSDPNAKVPAVDDIAGSREGNADARTIVTIATWDKWILESAQQLEYAVSQGIAGASIYRLVLQNHGVSGKALAQAQAEAVKSGYGYIQAEMEVIACNKDIANLKALRRAFKGQAAVYAQAEAKFFTRFLSVRTSLVMEMRKLVWAYQYWALADSSIVLDFQKSSADFQADLATLNSEVEAVNERYATDFQRTLPSLPVGMQLTS